MTTLHPRRDSAVRVAAEMLAVAATLALLVWGAFRLSHRTEPVAVFVTLVASTATALLITRLVRALRASDTQWKNVFDNNPTMYFMVGESGTIQSVNPAGAEQLGYTVDELSGQPVLNVFLEEDRAAARAHVARCLAHVGESMSWELRKVRKDGTMLWVRETARAVQRGTASPIVLIACEDITERRADQDRLRDSEAQLRWQANLLDLTHDTVFVRDRNDVIVYWNRGAEQLYGWSKDEAVGRVTHELLRTSFTEPLTDIMATLQRTDRWEGELGHTKRDGTRLVVASRWSVQRDVHGQPIGVLETNNDVSEQKRAEEELRRSEAVLAQAQLLSHTGSFDWDTTTGAIYWSEESYRIFGVNRGTTLSIDVILDRVHPDDRTAFLHAIASAQHESGEFEQQYRLLMPDGSRKHLHVVARGVTEESGAHVFVGAVMDITHQKVAEEERRAHLWFLESMDRVNRAIQGSNDIDRVMSDVIGATLSIFECDQVTLSYPCDPDAALVRTVVARTRPEFPRIYGPGPEGTPVTEASARILRAVRDAAGPIRFNAGTEPPLTNEGMRLTGAQSALVLAVHPKVDAPYFLALIQCSHVRVWTPSEERLCQEIGRRLGDALTTLLVLRDLRESARRYRNIFQTAGVSIWEQDFSRVETAIETLRADGVSDLRRYLATHPEFVAQTVQLVRIIDVNDATLHLFGAETKHELLDSLDKVFTPETLDVFVGELLAVDERRTSFASEAVVQTLSGERLDVVVTITFPPRPGSLESVLVSIMDVTARKRAEDALRTAQAELGRASTLMTMGQLAGSLAHELRQPLAAIAMNGSAALRWLNRESPDLGEVQEAAERIVGDAHRADEVIQGLRALVGESTPLREALDMNDAVHQVLELARGELRRNAVSVHADLEPVLPSALGDRVQLQQVLLNLILNAMEAMAPITGQPRELVIRTARGEGNGVVVTVEDTGPGLDPLAMPRIFDAFYSTKPHGLGMGLSICRSIVEAHGGTLSAVPRSPRGTAFRFTVPAFVDAVD